MRVRWPEPQGLQPDGAFSLTPTFRNATITNCELRHYLRWIEGLTTNQDAGGSSPSWRASWKKEPQGPEGSCGFSFPICFPHMAGPHRPYTRLMAPSHRREVRNQLEPGMAGIRSPVTASPPERSAPCPPCRAPAHRGPSRSRPPVGSSPRPQPWSGRPQDRNR